MKDKIKKISRHSTDLVQENIKKISMLFPEILTEGKIDFDKLRLILGDAIEQNNEKYELNWHGKKDSIRLAQQPTVSTLKPDIENSLNWTQTNNLYIEGDNLEVLKILQKSYSNKIKLIYIDPPYNTGKDFVYKDNFKNSIDNYLHQTGKVNSDGNKLNVNSETSGRYHTNWLNMIYPRLKLAYNLLTEDGVFFANLSDAEAFNMKKIADEIFGEKHFKVVDTNIKFKRVSNESDIRE